MSEHPPFRLPTITDSREEPEAAACEPRIGVTLEEAAIVAAIHGLRRRAEELRERIAGADDDERGRLASQLEALRVDRAELERRREQASRRKMQMLGHLPDDVELL